MSDKILIKGLEISCVVGVLPDERGREQPMRVDMELTRDLKAAGRSGRIRDTSDYARIAHEVNTLVRFRRYRLLEVAASEIAAMLFGLEPDAEHISLTLEKPAALQGLAAGAGVNIERSRGDFARDKEVTKFGEVDILVENREAGLYLLHIEPGRSIPAHYHSVMRELEWLVYGRVLRSGEPLQLHNPVAWNQGEVHSYQNIGEDRATLFCVDTPPFQPDDEIEVGAP